MSNDRKTLAKYGAQIPTGPRRTARPAKPSKPAAAAKSPPTPAKGNKPAE
jgi:hypothetical protein